MSEFLLLEIADGVAVITLNRPKANALSLALLQELSALFDTLEQDDAARVVVITGAGEKFFSGGADIREFGQVEPREQITYGQELFRRIELFPKVVIAAVNGIAFGGACELSMACHLRFASNAAQFALPEVKLGIIPGWGGTQRMPRLLGKGRALEFMLTGEVVPAREAERIGLVNRVYPAAQFMAETMAFARRLAKGAPLAQRAILLAAEQGLTRGYDSGIATEREEIIGLISTEDAGIGIAAFLTKQEPEFIGH